MVLWVIVAILKLHSGHHKFKSGYCRHLMFLMLKKIIYEFFFFFLMQNLMFSILESPHDRKLNHCSL